MTLTIDSTPCELPADTRIQIGYDAERLRSPNDAQEGSSVEILLPYSPANDRLFNVEYPFNARTHTVEFTHEGALIARGTARLLAQDDKGFHIEIRSGGARWAKNAARTPFKQIPVNYTGYLTPSDISVGWSDTRPVKFLPVLRDSYAQINSSTDLQPVLRLLSPDDYHPFLHIHTLVSAIFTQAGYTIESQFLESQFFRSLYISGAYSSRDTAAAEKRMGFCAVRLTSVKATADNIGRVYATPYGSGDIVGNIVETATPLSVDEQGVARSEPYNNGNCFGLEDRKIVYRPSSVISVGFEYHLRYTTQHRILSRERLKGFDTLNLGTGGNITFSLPNRYADRRNELTPNMTYRVIVFNSAPDAQYKLYYTYNGVPRTGWADFTGSTTRATTLSGGSASDPELHINRSGVWAPYGGDWALYDGYIEERGESTVELTIRTPAQSVGPSAPKYFNTIFFAGADPGMSFTLHPQCSLRPVFSSAPGYGARVTMAELSHHNIRQQVLLDALQHLFNLRFYTDEQTKKVYIEPEADFWKNTPASPTANWLERTDFEQPILREDVALDHHRSITYAYRAGDGASTRLEEQEGLPFGSWQATVDSYAAIEGNKSELNALFSPTVNITGSFLEAPSASLMQVGDRDDLSGDGINFTPRIVSYRGLRPLPAGERWPGTSGSSSYPFAAFHHLGTYGVGSFTLCFDDRNGMQGLHSFYDREQAIRSHGQHVTLTLRIEPHELESLFAIGSGAPDLRWVFRITTDRGEERALLRRIESYNPVETSARCTFTTLP